MAFTVCLPKELRPKFIQALKDGSLDLSKLSQIEDSAERRAEFAKIVGEENAKDINTLFESKLILKDQKAGLIRFIKSVGGLSPEIERTLLSKVSKLDHILSPEEGDKFLADLAEKKVGAESTPEQAQHIMDLAEKANEAKARLNPNRGWQDSGGVAYGEAVRQLGDYVESLKPSPTGWGYWVAQIANLPRTALTSILHFSAPFVQGWGIMGQPEYFGAWGEMIKDFADEKNFERMQADILGHPDYPLMARGSGRVSFTDLSDNLSRREEAIQSSLLQKVPGLGRLVTASSRGFVGFLNYARAHMATRLYAAARLRGEDLRPDSDAVRQINAVVNDFTGRGAIPQSLGIGASWLNAAFFSPRKISGEIRMFNPIRYLDPRTSQTARLGALRNISGSLIATGVILELAHLLGAKVNLNPVDTKFLKIQVGNSTFDITGGNAIYARTIARIITNQEVTSSGAHITLGEKYGSQTGLNVLEDFVRGKLSPNAAVMADILARKDMVGNPLNFVGENGKFSDSELFNKMTPIVIQDMIKLQETDPSAAEWVPALSAVFGVGMETSKPKK